MTDDERLLTEQQMQRIELMLQAQLAETVALKATLQALMVEAVCLAEGGEELMQAIENRVRSTLTPKADATADQQMFHSMASQSAKALFETIRQLSVGLS